LINKKWKSSLQDVRAYRGADVATDHALMIAKLALKLKATQKTQTKESPAYDSDKLSNTKVQHEFTMQLTNRFESMALDLNHAVSVEKTWTALKETYNQVAKETIGHQKRLIKIGRSDSAYQRTLL
jgi:hypothetical protein